MRSLFSLPSPSSLFFSLAQTHSHDKARRARYVTDRVLASMSRPRAGFAVGEGSCGAGYASYLEEGRGGGIAAKAVRLASSRS